MFANLILNDLDWWVARQWEKFDIGMKSESDYKNYNSWQTGMRAKLKKTNLKAGRIVRFADDFVIFCKTEKEAKGWYFAVKAWMKDNLKLEISEEKSSIIDLTKNSLVFLGFEIKANKQGKACVGSGKKMQGTKGKTKYTKISVSSKNTSKIVNNFRHKIKRIIQITNIKEKIKLLMLFNICILGYHNYWNIASEGSKDFYRIYKRLKSQFWKLRKQADSKPYVSQTFHKLYVDYEESAFSISGITIYPIWGCRYKSILPKSRDYCYYDEICNLSPTIQSQLKIMCRNYNSQRSVEYNDNRLSRYSMQGGKDAVTGKFLLASEVHCHHVQMISKGGTDKFDNLVIVSNTTHKWIHMKEPDVKELNEQSLEKLNKFRKNCGREPLKNRQKIEKREN